MNRSPKGTEAPKVRSGEHAAVQQHTIQSPARHATEEEWLSIKEVQQRTGLSISTIRRYMDAGIIPYRQFKKGGALRFLWSAVQAVAAKLQKQCIVVLVGTAALIQNQCIVELVELVDMAALS